jgi:hypothetical protein
VDYDRDRFDHLFVPAPPGYKCWWIADGTLFGDAPILGWIVERRKTEPRAEGGYFWWHAGVVTPEDIMGANDQEYAVEYPDARVWLPEDMVCSNIEGAKIHVAELWEKEKEAKANREAAKIAKV